MTLWETFHSNRFIVNEKEPMMHPSYSVIPSSFSNFFKKESYFLLVSSTYFNPYLIVSFVLKGERIYKIMYWRHYCFYTSCKYNDECLLNSIKLNPNYLINILYIFFI